MSHTRWFPVLFYHDQYSYSHHNRYQSRVVAFLPILWWPLWGRENHKPHPPCMANKCQVETKQAYTNCLKYVQYHRHLHANINVMKYYISCTFCNFCSNKPISHFYSICPTCSSQHQRITKYYYYHTIRRRYDLWKIDILIQKTQNSKKKNRPRRKLLVFFLSPRVLPPS